MSLCDVGHGVETVDAAGLVGGVGGPAVPGHADVKPVVHRVVGQILGPVIQGGPLREGLLLGIDRLGDFNPGTGRPFGEGAALGLEGEEPAAAQVALAEIPRIFGEKKQDRGGSPVLFAARKKGELLE